MSSSGPMVLPGPLPMRARIRLWAFSNALVIGPLAALLSLFVLFSVLAPDTFLTTANLFNILGQASVIAVMATGVTAVLLLGEIDLQFAAVAVLSGMVAALIFAGMPLNFGPLGAIEFAEGGSVLPVLLPLLLGGLLGLLAGFLTARLGLPSVIATLGILMLAQGLAFYWSQGQIVYNVMPLASRLGSGFIGPVPTIVLPAGLIMLGTHIMLSRTRFGRYVYMTGANRRAAELSGINTRVVIMQVFAFAGLLSAIGGILNMGRLGSAQASTGQDLLLPVLAAVFLGGNSMFGGIGGIHHTLIGVLLFAVLNNGLDQTDIDIFAKPFLRGGFLLAAVLMNLLGLRLARRATQESIEVFKEEGSAPSVEDAKTS
jgi:ribose transport system permease protein